jgi:hypothetical protein
MKWLLALLLCAAGTTWAADDMLRGRYYFGHEVESFQPCGSKKAYWVRGGDRTLQPLRQRAERLREMRGKPYQPIYLEATGTIDTKSAREGFARDYDGVVHLRKVARISNAIPQACGK